MKLCQVDSCMLPVFGKGYCRNHQYLRGDKDYSKSMVQRSYEKAVAKKVNGSNGKDELNEWFAARRKEMKGRCANCGKPSCKDNDQYFKFSIAHILEKAHFPSVATNENNWVELCFFGDSCHTRMDNKILDMTDMACWDEIVVKFQKMYPLILKEERRRIPSILLEYLNTDT